MRSAGSEIPSGAASSTTVASPRTKRATMARRLALARRGECMIQIHHSQDAQIGHLQVQQPGPISFRRNARGEKMCDRFRHVSGRSPTCGDSLAVRVIEPDEKPMMSIAGSAELETRIASSVDVLLASFANREATTSIFSSQEELSLAAGRPIARRAGIPSQRCRHGSGI